MQIFVVHQYNSGLGRLSVNVVKVSISHTHARAHTHTHSKTPLKEWSDRRRSRYVHNTQQTQKRTSMPPAGYESAIPAIKWLQNYALDRTATAISISCKHALEMLPDRSRLQTLLNPFVFTQACSLFAGLTLINFVFQIFSYFVPQSSTSFMSYTIQDTLAWIT